MYKQKCNVYADCSIILLKHKLYFPLNKAFLVDTRIKAVLLLHNQQLQRRNRVGLPSDTEEIYKFEEFIKYMTDAQTEKVTEVKEFHAPFPAFPKDKKLISK